LVNGFNRTDSVWRTVSKGYEVRLSPRIFLFGNLSNSFAHWKLDILIHSRINTKRISILANYYCGRNFLCFFDVDYWEKDLFVLFVTTGRNFLVAFRMVYLEALNRGFQMLKPIKTKTAHASSGMFAIVASRQKRLASIGVNG